MPQFVEQMSVSPADFVCGAAGVSEEGGEWSFLRFTPGQAAAYRDAGLDDFHEKTFATAGVRLALRTDAEALSFHYRFARGSSRTFGFFDVRVNGAIVAHGGLEEDDGALHPFVVELAPGEKSVEVYFPWSRRTFISNFALRRVSFAAPLRRTRKMLCFGDSITQGYDARHPSLAYAEALARFLDADPVNKAVGGDFFFPALLRERDAFEPDFITVAYGTNDWRRKAPDDVQARASAFLRRLSELYPSARILVITPLWRAEPASLSAFGEDVRAVDRLVRGVCASLPNVAVVSGYNLVPHLPEFFSDGRLHPNDLGFGVLAQNLQREVAAVLTQLSGRCRLASVFAPVVVGVPPANAFRDMMALPSGEIRHYGYRLVDGVKRPVCLSSDDSGFSWREFPQPAGHPGATVQSPWSGDWITLLDVHDMKRDLHLASLPFDLPPGLHVFRSSNGPDGPFKATLVTERGAACPRQPLALRFRRRWILAFQRRENSRHRLYVLRSDDDGRTWAESEVGSSPPDHVAAPPHKGVRWQNQGCEPTVVELSDGRLWMLIRTSTDFHWESFSCDGGETWSPVRPSRFRGTLTMPTLHRLRDGRILALWCNTAPLPEIAHDQPELQDWEREGYGEDVFTNRDAFHAAISCDDGRTWRGFRELLLNPCRCDADFRTRGGNADSLDKSVHQSQALELPDGKILVSVGQHETCRRFVVFDPAWLMETERTCDFSFGCDDWSVQLYVRGILGNFKPPAGHCAYNRRPGAQLAPDPDPEDGPREVLQIARIPDPRLVSDRQGAVWNFPALASGRLDIVLRFPAGSQGVRLSLLDHWRNPCDETVADEAACSFALVPGSDIPCDRWLRFVADWNTGMATLSVDGVPVAECALRGERPNGLSYLHLQTIATGPDFAGVLVRFCSARLA